LFREVGVGWRLGVGNRVEYWVRGGKPQDAVLPVIPEKYFDLKFEFS
jgi:hypothetical protein